MITLQFLTNTHMDRRSGKMIADMPRVAYLAGGIAAAAVLLHSVLLPVAKQDQLMEVSRFLAILDIDQDNDGIKDLDDRKQD